MTHAGLWRSTHTISGYSRVGLGGNSTPCTVPRTTVSNNTVYSAPCCTNGLFVLMAKPEPPCLCREAHQDRGLLSCNPGSAGQLTFSLVGASEYPQGKGLNKSRMVGQMQSSRMGCTHTLTHNAYIHAHTRHTHMQHTRICTHRHTNAFVHTYIHAYMHTHMHTHAYTHNQLQSRHTQGTGKEVEVVCHMQGQETRSSVDRCSGCLECQAQLERQRGIALFLSNGHRGRNNDSH